MAKLRVHSMIHYLGVDGGGTSTNFKLYNEEGKLVESISLPSIHFMKVNKDEMIKILTQANEHFKSKNYTPSNFKIVMGLGGYGANQEIRTVIEYAVYKVFPQAKLMNDAQLALVSALSNKNGIFLISGTGSIALRQENGILTRCGGYGYLLGDEGSAFWIGKKILERFIKESDDRLPKTNLTPAVMEYFKISNPHELIQIIADKKDIYRELLAQLSGAMHAIDSIRDIYENAGMELALLANSFNPTENTPLAFGGSVLLKNEVVRSAVLKSLNSNLVFLESQNDPEYAAFLINQTEIAPE